MSLTIFCGFVSVNSALSEPPIIQQCQKDSSTLQRIKTRVIINPKSGTNNKRNIEKLIYRFFDQSAFDFEVFYTNGPNHAYHLSKEAALSSYDLVIAVGGDGTVNEVGKGLIGSHTAMGIIPSGSGNGLAKHLNISSDPKKAIQVIKRFQCMSIDTIQINRDQLIGIAGIGFDANIARQFATSNKRGFWSYAALVLKEYPCYSSRIFEMEIDGTSISVEGLLVSFANSSQYGNDIKIAPQASLCDGYINIVVLKKPPFYVLPDILMKLRNGTITHSKYYESMCCREVVVHTKNLIAHIDGEPAFFENGISLKVLPKSLKVVVPF
jgi:YegS/Rv2252/BmrU family lipid kinase